jgi:hypothetical protein
MTRTDVMASSRPQTAGAASKRNGSTRIQRGLLILPVLLLMAFALVIPSSAVAAEGTSGYNQTPTTPTTTPTTGTSPSKETEKSTPASKEEPSKTTTAPSAEKASTLPFTGLDLRWTVGIGLLLMGAGFSIVVVQRREGRRGSR